MIAVGPAPGKGRGVFATQNIQPDDLLEVCDVEAFGPEHWNEIRRQGKWEEAFVDRVNYRFCPSEPFGGFLANGLVALANHSETPNAVVGFKGGKAYFTAIRAIRKGQEVTICYPNAAEYPDYRSWT